MHFPHHYSRTITLEHHSICGNNLQQNGSCRYCMSPQYSNLPGGANVTTTANSYCKTLITVTITTKQRGIFCSCCIVVVVSFSAFISVYICFSCFFYIAFLPILAHKRVQLQGSPVKISVKKIYFKCLYKNLH